jgi:hypothetical protein
MRLVSLKDRVTGGLALGDATGQYNIATRRMQEASVNLAGFAPTNRTFALKEPTLPSSQTLSLLGRLVDESIEYDLALTEITNQELRTH